MVTCILSALSWLYVRVENIECSNVEVCSRSHCGGSVPLTPKTDSCVDCSGSVMHGSHIMFLYYSILRMIRYDFQGCTASNDCNALAPLELETYEQSSWFKKLVR